MSDGNSPARAESTSEKSCGDCASCCVDLPIAAGIVAAESKAAGVACPQLCAGRCAIYQQRPQMCRDFQCAWMKFDDWPLAWRPEQSQLLCLFEFVNGDAPAGLVYELQPGALQTPVGRDIVQTIRARVNFVIVVDHAKNRQKLLGEITPERALA